MTIIDNDDEEFDHPTLTCSRPLPECPAEAAARCCISSPTRTLYPLHPTGTRSASYLVQPSFWRSFTWFVAPSRGPAVLADLEHHPTLLAPELLAQTCLKACSRRGASYHHLRSTRTTPTKLFFGACRPPRNIYDMALTALCLA